MTGKQKTLQINSYNDKTESGFDERWDAYAKSLIEMEDY